MYRLRIGHKLGAIVLLMGVPIVALVYLFIESQNRQIAATRNELAGLEYMTGVRGLLEHLPHHFAAAAAAFSGDAQARREMQAAEPQVDADIAALDSVEAKYGVQLRTRTSWEAIKTAWNDLKARSESGMTPAESLAAHTALTSMVLAHVQLVGERSSLRTDPDLDTFYLADGLVNTLPSSSEFVGELLAFGAGVTARRAATPEESAELTYLTRQIRQSGEQIKTVFQTAIRYNPKLSTALSAPMNTAVDAGNTFSGFTADQLLRGFVGVADSGELVQRGKEALHQYFRLYDLTAGALDNQLRLRVESLSVGTYKQLLLAGVVLVIAVLAVFMVSTGITFQVRAITNTFSEVAAGNYGARVAVRSGDELGEMARSLNATFDQTLALVQSKDERDRIQTSIQKLLEEVSGVAEGDLSKEAEVTADVTGAIADSFNYMIAELRQIISQVQKTTHEVTASAQQVQATAESLAEGSQAQSVQIIEASSAIGDMAQSIQKVSHSANSAAVVAEQALFSAQQGTQSVNKTIDGMNSIRNQVQETAKRIKRLGESSQEIGEIVELIGDIADRTSILALNASIQAAMAGEAGKGFAVVAEEVERLADQATESTRRIAGIIKSVQGDTNEAISAMESTTKEVVSGSQLANEAGLRLAQIVDVSKRISELVRSISEAAQQQAEGSEFVARNVTGISAVTQQTAEGAQQAADQIRRLSNLAVALNDSVSRFRTPENARITVAA